MTDTAHFEPAGEAGISDNHASDKAALPLSEPALPDSPSDALRTPADDASPEEWRDFYGLLGRPEAPGDYKFKMPDGLSEDFPYEAEAVKRYAEWAHEAGLSPRQAQSLHDRFVQDTNGQFTQRQHSDDEAVAGAHEALIKAWGTPETERYRRNVELANRAIRELGGTALEQSLKARNVITADGEITEASVAFMLQQAGERLFAEDQVFAGTAAARNPFAGDGENITEQGQVLRQDPELARSMIRAANREAEFPRLFGGEF